MAVVFPFPVDVGGEVLCDIVGEVVSILHLQNRSEGHSLCGEEIFPLCPHPKVSAVSPDSPCSAFVQLHACPGLHTPGQLWRQKEEEAGIRAATREEFGVTECPWGEGLGVRKTSFPTPGPGEFLALWAGMGSWKKRQAGAVFNKRVQV